MNNYSIIPDVLFGIMIITLGLIVLLKILELILIIKEDDNKGVKKEPKRQIFDA